MDYTPIQRRIMEVLKDGKPHARSEVFECLQDSLSGDSTLRVHICYLRKRLRSIGKTIIWEANGGAYRLVRFVDDGD